MPCTYALTHRLLSTNRGIKQNALVPHQCRISLLLYRLQAQDTDYFRQYFSKDYCQALPLRQSKQAGSSTISCAAQQLCCTAALLHSSTRTICCLIRIFNLGPTSLLFCVLAHACARTLSCPVRMCKHVPGFNHVILSQVFLLFCVLCLRQDSAA